MNQESAELGQSDGGPIDLQYPSTYHRHKAAVFGYSAALFLLAVAAENKVKFGASEFSLTLSTDFLCFLLWLVATYYGVVFWLDVQATRWLNSERLAGKGSIALDDSLKTAAQELQLATETLQATKFDLVTFEQSLSPILQEYSTHIKRPLEGSGRSERIHQGIAEALEMFPNEDTNIRAARLSDLINSIMSEERALIGANVKNSLGAVRDKCEALANSTQVLHDEVATLKQGLETFSVRVGKSRTRSFLLLEKVVPMVLYGIGTLCMFYECAIRFLILARELTMCIWNAMPL